jgi:hypothetical protein
MPDCRVPIWRETSLSRGAVRPGANQGQRQSLRNRCAESVEQKMHTNNRLSCRRCGPVERPTRLPFDAPIKQHSTVRWAGQSARV